MASFPLSCTLAMLSAFGCFMLIFTARNTHNRVDFWERTECIQTLGQHTWALLFVVIPGIGAGFLQVMEAVGEFNENDRRLEDVMDATCDPESADLLNVTSSIFQLLTCFLNLLAIENENIILLSLRSRMSIRVFFALASSILIITPDSFNCLGPMPVAAIVSPLCLIMSAAIEIFGLQTVGYEVFFFKNKGFFIGQ